MDAKSNKNIYQRISNIREQVSYLKKDAEVQGYKAITHDLVTAAVRKPMIENGVVIVPNQKESSIEHIGSTKNGTPIYRYGGWYEIKFVNMDEPSDSTSVTLEAHANDSGDKAPGKALSYAVKNALLKILNIETGESDESRVEIAEGLERIDEKKADEIRALIKETDSDEAKMLRYMKHMTIEDFTNKDYEKAIRMLNKKKNETAK